MQVEAIKTEIFHPHGDLHGFLCGHLGGKLANGDVVAVTSKIVSLAEGCLVPTDSITKRDLIAREADLILGEGDYGAVVTLKHGLMIPTAGIDESNSETGDYILYPRDPFASAERIWRQLREVFGLEKLGVIITDSHSRPFRRGVTGIALSYWGLNGGRSLIGEPDIFGRPLKHTFVDVVDSLAAAAVLMMGEAADRCPLAYLRKAPVEFCEDGRGQAVAMKPEDDMYFPLFRPKRNSR